MHALINGSAQRVPARIVFNYRHVYGQVIAQKAQSLDECLWVMSTMLRDQMSAKVSVKKIAHTVHRHLHVRVRGLVPIVLACRSLFFKYGRVGSEREVSRYRGSRSYPVDFPSDGRARPVSFTIAVLHFACLDKH